MTAFSAKAAALLRDVQQLFARVGIPAKGKGPAGGYQAWGTGSRVRVMWWAEAKFDAQSGERGVDHPDHPLVRLERATTLAMEQAMADVLYVAGFTVALIPGVSSRDEMKARDPQLMVIEPPEFKAWTLD